MAKKSRRRKTWPLTEDDIQLGLALALESDRGCVLVAYAFIEEAIENLLRSYLGKIGAKDAGDVLEWLLAAPPLPPLGNSWVKASLCRVFGLINEQQYRQLERFRDLRNDFAHTPGRVELTAEAVSRIEAMSPWPKGSTDLFRKTMTPVWESQLNQSEAKVFSESRVAFMALSVDAHLMLLAIEHILGTPLWPITRPGAVQFTGGPDSPTSDETQ